MGKGDKKSRRGKIWKGSYGNSRRRKANKKRVAVAKAAPQPEVVTEVVAVKPKAPRKPAKKKTEA
jgi:30S ribosomal protein S31